MTSPVGDDVEQAARELIDPIIDALIMHAPVEWLLRVEWHRAVFTRAAAMLSAERGYPLAMLRKQGLSQAQIVAMLAAEGIQMSDSRVGQLVAGISADQPS